MNTWLFILNIVLLILLFFFGILTKSSLQAKLRLAAYEALMEIIKNSPTDCYSTVQKTTLFVLERLNQVLVLGGQMQNHSERNEMTDLQSLLCATLQVYYVVVVLNCFDTAILLFFPWWL